MSPDCLKLRPQTCFCQLLAYILDRQGNVPREYQSSSRGFILFLWGANEPVGSIFVQGDCFGSAVSLGTVLQAAHCLHVQRLLPPMALACRLVGEFLFGHNKQGGSGERAANPPVSLFSGILKYGMEY